jgi:hypothetical protein
MASPAVSPHPEKSGYAKWMVKFANCPIKSLIHFSFRYVEFCQRRLSGIAPKYADCHRARINANQLAWTIPATAIDIASFSMTPRQPDLYSFFFEDVSTWRARVD